MKKTILAITVGILGIGSAYADDDFRMFTDKKLQKTATEKKTVTPLTFESKSVSQKQVEYTVGKNNSATPKSAAVVAPAPVPPPTVRHISQEPDVAKIVADKQKPMVEEETPVAIEKGSWVDKYKNTEPNGLALFPDNGSSQVNGSFFSSFSAKSRTEAALGFSMNDNDHAFFDTLAKMDAVHASGKSSKLGNQAKLKSYDYEIYLLAEKGNENAIDYLCLNPKDSPYIQTSTMKHYCNIASINGHVELLGFRVWSDDAQKVQVSNYHTNRRHQDLLAQKSLNQGASWASVLEAKRISGDSIKREVHQKLHEKKSSHWLHYNALDYVHKEYITH